MRTLSLLLLCLVFGPGCGARPPDSEPTEPLTIEDWTSLPAETKFTIPTLERLKAGTPRLQDDKHWRQFAVTVLNPAKKKELPQGSVVR